MLDNFFSLNSPTSEFRNPEDLFQHLRISKDFRNILYRPDKLEPTSGHPRLKIKGCSFTNFSFAKTELFKISFYNCRFEDTLFIGTVIKQCEFHNCTFKNCNTHKILIEETYLNPKSFKNSLKGRDKANIAIHLYQQLKVNSINQEQSDFRRNAEFNFRKWKDRISWTKYFLGTPYKTNLFEFLREYPFNFLYRILFGYGLRLRNFLLSFLLMFSVFSYINFSQWGNFGFTNNADQIETLSPDSVNVASSIFYTFETTTKLIDTNLSTTTRTGLNWLTFQSVVGFVFLSALVTIIFNRFIK